MAICIPLVFQIDVQFVILRRETFYYTYMPRNHVKIKLTNRLLRIGKKLNKRTQLKSTRENILKLEATKKL